MKKSLSVLALSLAAAFAGSAHAAGSNFYAGAGLGVADNSLSGIQNSKGFAGSIVGGYQFTPSVAVEVQYNDLGKVQGSSGNQLSAKVSGFSTSVVGFLPINERFSATGKLGIASTTVALSDAAGGRSNNTSVAVGVGIQFAENPHLLTRGGVDVYGVGDGFVLPKAHVTVFTVSEVYKF